MFQRGDLILIERLFDNFVNQQPIRMYAFVLKVYNQNKAFVKLLSIDFKIDEQFRKKELKNWKRYGILDNTGYYFDCVNHNERYTVLYNMPISKNIVSINSSKTITTYDRDITRCTGQSCSTSCVYYEKYHVNLNSIYPFIYVYYPETDIGAFSLGLDYKSEQRALYKAKLYSVKSKLEDLNK